MVIRLALALRQQFSIHDQVLEHVDVFKYLGRLLSQDDDDIQAIRTQIRKARTTWARVSNVLRAQNAPPWISAKFYKMVVQSLLLYGSETWVISKLVLARLEISISERHTRWQNTMCLSVARIKGGPIPSPKLEDVLEECKLCTIVEYIKKRRDTIAVYMVEHSIFCDCMD